MKQRGNEMKISVAMAAYNGEKYITRQIDSILSQLGDADELVVSCNPSKDATFDILREYASRDERVKPVICRKKGVLPNFENAIGICRGDIIFLSDQDDVWEPGKVERIRSLFKKDRKLGGVVHGYKNIDENGNVLPEQPAFRPSYRIRTHNIIIKNPVQGSCLAFRRELVPYILPFPVRIPMHDSYIGLVICRYSKLIYIPDTYLLYRKHEENVTTRHHKPLFYMIRDRLWLLGSLNDIRHNT